MIKLPKLKGLPFFKRKGAEGEPAPKADAPAPRADAPAPKAAGKRLGGYGVHLIRNLMDKVVWNSRGNVVVAIKYLR